MFLHPAIFPINKHLLIFVKVQLHKHSLVILSPSGWINNDLFLQWFDSASVAHHGWARNSHVNWANWVSTIQWYSSFVSAITHDTHPQVPGYRCPQIGNFSKARRNYLAAHPGRVITSVVYLVAAEAWPLTFEYHVWIQENSQWGDR